MNDDMTTLGCVMALEPLFNCDEPNGDPGKKVLLIVCPATETDQGMLEVTARTKDLAYMGFMPAAIVRCNRNNASVFFVFALPGLSESVQSALANQSGSLIQDALSAQSDDTDMSIPLSCEPPAQ